MARDVAIAIGVADARPLSYLGGATNGARAFHDWASKLQYDSRLLIDDDQPVTMERLRSALETMLEPGHYDIVLADSTNAYSLVKRVRPDLVLIRLRVDTPEDYHVLSMLKLDPESSPIRVLTCTAADHPEEPPVDPTEAPDDGLSCKPELRMN